jgi:protein-S-isoprenylcysteine O-methyltransferase Ste14
MDIENIFRLVFFVVLLLALLISGTYRRRAREEGGVIERRAEGGSVLFLRMLFAFPLLVVLLLYIFYPQALVWATLELPIWLRILGAVIAILCIPLILWVFRNIGKNISETVLTKESHELVTSGPYHWVRHPLYASALLLLFSLSLVSANWFIFLYTLIGSFVFRFVVVPAEEKKLTEAFGEEYTKYQSRTGALIPKLF